MPATKPRPKQSLVSLLRELRPMFGKDVVKTGPTEYLVNGRAVVKMAYYCTRDPVTGDKKDTTKTCHPNHVTITPCLSLIEKQTGAHPTSGSVFRTKTINRSMTGIRAESIATAVNQCCDAVDAFITRQKEYNARKAKEEEELMNAVKGIDSLTARAGLRKGTFSKDYSGNRRYVRPGSYNKKKVGSKPQGSELSAEHVEISVARVHLENDTTALSYGVEIEGIDQEALVKVLEALCQ